jgi:DNA mismatch repair protein MutS
LHNPLVKNAIGNPVNMSSSENVMFLTGPNMAGKTTYLKAAGIALLLSHTGMRVPANRAKISIFDCLLTSIHVSDNLPSGISFYMAEVNRVKEAAIQLASGKRSLMLFDEIFKGTNLADALDATQSVLLECTEIKSSAFLFSSHLVELIDRIMMEGISFKYFSGDISGNDIKFSYSIKNGYSSQRLGLKLLKNAKVVQLLKQARSNINELQVT